MITCNLNGRMGNQMFQIAATIATAMKYNVPYLIPKETIRMDLFQSYFPYLHNPNLMGIGTRYYIHDEKKPEYEPINYPGGTLKLNGYFQSYKYFEEYREKIIEKFPMWTGGLNKGIVSIHIRRGDYLELPDFIVISIYYYSQAINYFKEKGYKTFLVFSDDMDWCSKNINSNIYKDCDFKYAHGNPKHDLINMSACEHNIIANSTFSWWAAWLNQNPNKIVIAPDTWFKGVNKDLLPKEWLIFKNK